MDARSLSARSIGPWGTAARGVVGAAMVVGAFVAGVDTLDVVLGLGVFPLAVSAVVLARGRRASPIRLTGLEGHCINCGMIAAAFIVVPVAALLFYGSSMLVATGRGYGGCELFALSNWFWRRDDQIACPVFHVLDLAESRGSTREIAP